ncbi:flavin reductase family protein [Curtobacterium sp. MCBD17_035]|uniref:flavin reductase family protein n=1 Tax=Curtobacterium sp. MCBD17_035 TaxID=2175673 RepID=UPI000DA968E8|nr:flavin reductase family protein [Curtobacterium sp. MCBD17_035]WIB66559.1 flavin reductase family protein [Curtobacterium sp. MCBD17_035]
MPQVDAPQFVPGTPGDLTDAYKAAFRGHPAGVAVITADTPDGPTGLTASSVASVAVDPPVLVFSLSTNSGSAGAVLGAPLFVVHLMHAGGVELARRFASTGSPSVDEPGIWERLPSGDWYLPAAASVLRCRPLSTTPIGSSTVVVAEVLDIVLGLEQGEPLVYHNREFHSLTDRSRLVHPAAGPARPTQHERTSDG